MEFPLSETKHEGVGRSRSAPSSFMAKHYYLDFNTYSGMTIPITEGSYRDCLERAKRKVELAKKRDQPVNILIPNKQWEFETPEDAMMISDHDGILSIIEEGIRRIQ